MKAKLTLTVDEDLIPVAKHYAGLKGVSLSRMVEEALRKLAKPATPDPRFSRRWRGAFAPAGKDSPRYRMLAKRYL
ncbi:MAG: hypothetical protein HY343_07065 [Lentisphaerae bacterium]|nr:hypothetical protein [Lentisphaerota bacterium]